MDILVNNAGLIPYKLLGEASEKEFDPLFAVNVKGTYFACQQAANRMSDGGRIVNFSSSTTSLMLPSYSAYVGTKGRWKDHPRGGEGIGDEGHHRQLRLTGADGYGTIRRRDD